MSKFISRDDVILALQCLVYLLIAFALVIGLAMTAALALRAFQWIGGF